MLHIGLELSRDLKLGPDGRVLPRSTFAVGGVNLLRRQLQLALKLTAPECVQILSPDAEEYTLQLCGEFGCREGAALEWIARLSDMAAQARPEDAVVILRQMVPLRDWQPLREAIALLKRQRCVISASRPPAGHPRHKPLAGQTEPDYRCRAFEAWRLAEFAKHGFGGAVSDQDPPLFIDWDSFCEIDRPADEARAGELLARWGA